MLRRPADPESAQGAYLLEDGLGAWLRRQDRLLLPVLGAVCLVLVFLAFALGALPRIVPFAFLTGALLASLAGRLGMRLAAAAAPRAAAAARESAGAAWRVVFGAAAGAGLAAAALSLLDLCAWFAGLQWLAPRLGAAYSLPEITVILLCLALGSGLYALLTRMGGGLFAGAAGISSDLLIRSEAGVPEADGRNPALAAAQLGRIATGIGAWAADLFASQNLALAGAAVLGAAALGGGRADPERQLAAAALPLVIAGLGAAVSLGWVLITISGPVAKPADSRQALNRSAAVAAAVLAVFSGVAVALLLPGNFGLWGAIVAGLAAAAVAAKASEYATGAGFNPVRAAVAQGEAGPPAFLVEGLAAGLRSVCLPAVALIVAALAAFHLAGGSAGQPAMGFYGLGLAAVSMLALLGAMATAGACAPIAAAARDVLPPDSARDRSESLSAQGDSLASAARGLAVCAGGLATLAALPAILEALRLGLVLKNVNAEIIRLTADGPSVIRKVSEMRPTELLLYFDIGPANPLLAAGLLCGALAACLFAALLLRAAGRSAARLAQEARRQWRTIPGLAELKAGARPDPAGCVRALAGELHRQMILPAALALGIPAAAGIVLGAAGALGLAAGMLVVGLPLAVGLGASGWTWEAAGRAVEVARHGGRGSALGQAAATGRLLGDPLRALVGPGLEALIKLTAAVAAVTAGLTVKLAGAGSLLERLGALVTGLVG